MKNGNLIDTVLLSNPIHRGMIEYLLLIGTGILGLVFSWSKLPFFPMLKRIRGHPLKGKSSKKHLSL